MEINQCVTLVRPRSGPEYRWGREVLLPKGFDFAEAGRALRRPLGEWRRMGVTDVSGRPVEGFDFAEAGRALRRPLGEWRRMGVTDVSGRPVAELELPATLLLPAGHLGPATRNAIRSFQLSEGMIPDGFPGLELLARLEIE
jgi:membrane-bound lytic murein transglycosylase B